MDGNKDEALRCLEIAAKCISQGDKARAKKFIFKAEKLFPTAKAKGKPLALTAPGRLCYGRLLITVCRTGFFAFHPNRFNQWVEKFFFISNLSNSMYAASLNMEPTPIGSWSDRS